MRAAEEMASSIPVPEPTAVPFYAFASANCSADSGNSCVIDTEEVRLQPYSSPALPSPLSLTTHRPGDKERRHCVGQAPGLSTEVCLSAREKESKL